MRNVISDVFRQHWQDDVPIQYWEPLGQQCRGFLSMQCCPKSIKRTLNRIFSYAMLSGAWRTTLHKVFSVLPGNALGTILHRLKPLAVLSERLQTTLRKKSHVQSCLKTLGQHCTGKNPMQCKREYIFFKTTDRLFGRNDVVSDKVNLKSDIKQKVFWKKLRHKEFV